MVDVAFVIRSGPSGPDMPQGTPGYVLTVQSDGFSVKPEPAGGGGTLLPLSDVAFCDSGTTATTHDGNIESPFVDVQDAIDAGFTNILVCPGSYGAVALGAASYYIAAFGAAPSLNPPSVGLITSVDPSSVTLQGISPGGIDDSGSAGPVIFDLIDVVMSATITGSGQTVLRTGTVLQNVKPGFEPTVLQGCTACAAVSLAFTRSAGDINCSVLDAIYSRGTDIVCNASGTSRVKHSAFANVQFDLCDNEDCTITGTVTGDAGGGMQWRDSVLSGAVQNPISWDATTERRSLAAGVDLTAIDFVLALSSGQGGPAKVISAANTTINFANPVGPTNENVTRAIVCRGVGQNTTVTLDETSGVALQPFLMDCWQSGFTCTIKDSAAVTLQVVASNTAGNGTRNLFQIDGTTGKVVKSAPLQAL
jgi:hypothetical protein